MRTWNFLLLVLALAAVGCHTTPPTVHYQGYDCGRADAIVLRHVGDQDKPIFPIFIGVAGRQYPLDLLSGGSDAPEDLYQHRVDSTFYVALVAHMRRCLPAETHAPARFLEFGTFSLCLGREQVYLGSRRDAATFFQALLSSLVATTPAETGVKADLENIRIRIGR